MLALFSMVLFNLVIVLIFEVVYHSKIKYRCPLLESFIVVVCLEAVLGKVVIYLP